MRETLFRAKELTKGKWVYGDYFSQHKDGRTRYYIVEHPYGRDSGREVMWEVDPETRSFYTGINDKRGNAIFTGDVVDTPRREFEVILKSGAFWLQQGSWYVRLGEQLGEENIVEIYGGDMVQIIGNRWDTPHLLKGVA